MLNLYRFILSASQPLLLNLLRSRIKQGKEDISRINERKGNPKKIRPQGRLIWVHGASIGEAQSALILIKHLLDTYKDINILLTTGTLTSAQMMEKNLPERAFHQFYPLDHPKWVSSFLDHWKPDIALWMESELWPNMLGEIKARNIPAALINARLSNKSYRNWSIFKSSARRLLSSFDIILAQTEEYAERYTNLGAGQVRVTDNIKYSAAPLPADKQDLSDLTNTCKSRPVWLFASTHAGEEEMACRVHKSLKEVLPNLLTIIAPRHPARADEITASCTQYGLNIRLRGKEHNLPQAKDDIYIADTLGELGLLYRIAPVSCIGRSFSHDGGGGHNPIEAAQLGSAVLYGPNVQYQQQIFDDMRAQNAATQLQSETELTQTLQKLLNDNNTLQNHQKHAQDYANSKTNVINVVLEALTPILKTLEPADTQIQKELK